MKFIKKAAAVLFAAVILNSASLAAYAAEDDWGDEWETEEVNPAVTESAVSQPESGVESGNSESSKADSSKPVRYGNEDTSVTTTGDYSAVIPLLFAATGAAAAVFVVSLKTKKTVTDNTTGAASLPLKKL